MITQEQVDELKAQMIVACDKHLVEGGTIITTYFVDIMIDGRKRMCPLGCLSGGFNYFAKFNEILGLPANSYMEAYEFVGGFCGGTERYLYPSLLTLLGRELRAKYITKGT
jgi:hypothetical protein